jgi:pre-mRNA-splicing helicase BRR2
MIFSWRPETETVHSIRHQPDLSAEEALNALDDLLKLMFGDGSLEAVINVFSSIVRLGRIRIRRHEDALLRSIHDRVRVKAEPADYDSPYFKIFLLLQAHFYRLPLSPELAADLSIVLERVFSLFSVCAHDSEVNTDTRMLDVCFLMRMCVHGMWWDDPQLKQIPHFEDDVSRSIIRQDLRLIHASGYRTF